MQHPTLPRIDRPDFVIRPLVRADLNDWYAYLAQPRVYEHTSWELASANDLVPLFDLYDSEDPDSPVRFAVAAQDTNTLVGTIGLHTVSTRHGTAELAYDFSPAVWGRGLATASAQAMLAWAFQTLKFQRLQATVLPSNVASIRVLERCGMQFEGTLRNLRRVRGISNDFYMYSLILDHRTRNG